MLVLNDGMTPRPSLLSLVEKQGRRRSMVPQFFSGLTRDMFGKDKEDPKKSFFGLRTRSNSESGRGTSASSPDEGQSLHTGLGDRESSGLSTPVIVGRKQSLNSPFYANQVKNILNLLEEKGSTYKVNGECSSSSLKKGDGGLDPLSMRKRRNSFDDRIMLEDAAEALKVRSQGKRRGSLQAQRRFDEGDEDSRFQHILTIPTITEASSKSEESFKEITNMNRSSTMHSTPEGECVINIHPPSSTPTPSPTSSMNGSNFYNRDFVQNSYQPFNSATIPTVNESGVTVSVNGDGEEGLELGEVDDFVNNVQSSFQQPDDDRVFQFESFRPVQSVETQSNIGDRSIASISNTNNTTNTSNTTETEDIDSSIISVEEFANCDDLDEDLDRIVLITENDNSVVSCGGDITFSIPRSKDNDRNGSNSIVNVRSSSTSNIPAQTGSIKLPPLINVAMATYKTPQDQLRQRSNGVNHVDSLGESMTSGEEDDLQTTSTFV